MRVWLRKQISDTLTTSRSANSYSSPSRRDATDGEASLFLCPLPSRLLPGWELHIGHQLCFRSEGETIFSCALFPIVHGLSLSFRDLHPRYVLPASRYPRLTRFPRIRFSLIPESTNEISRETDPDSNSWPRITFGELQNVIRFRPQIWSLRADGSSAVTQASRQSLSLTALSRKKSKWEKRSFLLF